jgi:hypothetical protein
MLKHVIVGMTALALLSGGAAHAQSQSKAAAETAFRRGKELIAAGKVADACASFEQSQKLDPQLGTQYNLALCYERLGKLASAWVTFSELAARDSNAGRKADSSKRARKLEPKLTKMVIRTAEPTPGLVITQDGADVTLLVGTESPVDAGTYQFEARAPGRRTWTQPVTVTGEGRVVTIDVPVLDVDVSAAPTTPAPDDAATPLPRVDDTAPSRSGRTRRLIGLGVGGAGVLSVVVGSVFGVQAMGLKSDADDLCGGDIDDCTGDVSASQDKIDDARSKATLSTVFVGVGLAAVAGGAVLYFTAPSNSERSASLTPVIDGDQVGVALSGRF